MMQAAIYIFSWKEKGYKNIPFKLQKTEANAISTSSQSRCRPSYLHRLTKADWPGW